MNDEELKKYLDEIEKLSYKSRLPEHATLFRNKAIKLKPNINVEPRLNK